MKKTITNRREIPREWEPWVVKGENGTPFGRLCPVPLAMRKTSRIRSVKGGKNRFSCNLATERKELSAVSE